MQPVEFIADPDRATVLLRDPRRRILEMAREPVSTVEIAERMGETRQRVGYHVRCLVEAGLLVTAEVSRRGAMVEKTFRASANAYALAPDLLGPLAARVPSAGDRESLEHLLGAIHEVQADLAALLSRGPSASERLPTLTLSSRIRLRGARGRAVFAEALVRALSDVAATHADPFETDRSDTGDPFRLTLTLHPTKP